MAQPEMIRYAITLWLCVAPLAAQHGRYLAESKNPAIGDPQAIAAGGKLYATSCAGCHGPDGSGGRGPNLVRRSLWHPLSDQAIFTAIQKGVPGADMPPTKLSDEDTWKLVAFIHSMIGPASDNDVPGDPSAGEKIFWGESAGCSGCHSIGGRGSKLGPDLTNIGGRPLGLIKDAVLKRTRDLYLAGSEGVTVRMKDGSVIEGIARNRSNYSLQVVDKTGKLHLISMAGVRQVKVAGQSIMPNDYAKRLSKTEIDNLLAYLARQSSRRAN
jgi:putative heme-binding domain-containing protein